MYERIQVKQINDHIWLLDDNGDSTGYLVTGEKSGLIIDTMTGYENVRAVAEEITDLPLTVINTHGHPDHIYGNVYFEKVHIHPADIAVAERFYQDPVFVQAIREAGLHPAEFVPVTEGQNPVSRGQHFGTDLDAAAGMPANGAVPGILKENTDTEE